MALFTHTYAPKNSCQVFGQPAAMTQLKEFVVNYKQQKNKAALLYGPVGVGKTSSVYALAKELKYDVLEINSSDLRNEENMNSFLNSALGQQSLFFTPKIVLVDEIDNISGVKDRGCIPVLVKAIGKSTFPIVLTANDPFDSKFKSLRNCCLHLEFHKLQYRTIAHALKWVCEQEQIDFEDKAINTLARQVDGDLRGALIDLQICSKGKKFSFEKVSTLSDRKRTQSIISALRVILKSSSVDTALPALDDVDMDLKEIFLWMDENLPKEYLSPQSLARAYENLSRADVFYGRISKQQHWRFLVYVNNLLTAGISSSKEEKSEHFVQYTPTMRILRLWQAKMKNAKRKEIAVKLARLTHTSVRVALLQVPYLKAICKKKIDPTLIHELDLSEEEADWLKG